MTANDLFDFLPEVAAERRKAAAAPLVQALTCLRDSVPDTLQAVVHLQFWRDRDTRSPGASGKWAYVVCVAGLRHEPTDHWWTPTDGGVRGWNRTPATLTTWDELRAAIGDDPRRQDVITWVDSLTAPDRWRDLIRPHELWPDPDMWHPSYLESDRARPGYTDRLTAWTVVQQILTDAMEATA